MSHTVRLGGVVLLLLVASLFAPTQAPTATEPVSLSPEAAAFLRELVAFHAGAVRLGGLAEGRGSMPDVRDLATLARRDHDFALRRLTALADAAGVRVDEALRPSGVADALEPLAGVAFDRAWLARISEREGDLLRRVTAWRSTVPDGPLRALLDEQAPIVRQHLELVHHVGRELETAGGTP